MVPVFDSESIDQLGIQLCLGSIATTTPQTFIATSLPTRQAGYGVDHPHWTVVHCIPAHIRQIRAGASLTELYRWFLSYTV
jgi:hypothetical protein